LEQLNTRHPRVWIDRPYGRSEEAYRSAFNEIQPGFASLTQPTEPISIQLDWRIAADKPTFW
jgi:hypothetical protein